MENITLDQFQKNMNVIFSKIFNDQEPVSVLVDQDRSVVVLDADDYGSIMETLYLLSSPANAERLHEGIRQHLNRSSTI